MARKHPACCSPVLSILLWTAFFCSACSAWAQAGPPATTTQQPAPAQPAQQPAPVQPGQLPPSQQPGVKATGKTAAGEDKRILGVLPNYRTAEMAAEATPLKPSQKLRIALKDSFDYPLMLVGAGYALIYQAENTHPEFGQGTEGYFKRFGTSYADQADGNMMTEGFLPILLHQDPRYFRMAEGSKTRRTLYALSRLFVTQSDSGHKQFNYSEVFGNAISTGISLAYYPDARDPTDYMQGWAVQIATDGASQVLKEFWPDVKRWWYNKHHKPTS